MRTKATNIFCSASVLLLTLAAFWFLLACSVHTETPSRDPWAWFPEFYLAPLLLPIVTWFAARFWYCLPVFFGYGAFVTLPASWRIFGPQMRHGFFGATPPYSVLETLVFCCAGGLFAAFIGFLSSRATSHNTHNA